MSVNEEKESQYGHQSQDDQLPTNKGIHQGVVSADNIPPKSDSTIPADYIININSPPSYEYLYEKVKAATEKSQSSDDFRRKFIAMVYNTIYVKILLLFSLAISVAMIVMGIIHKDHCPAERMIPIFLIVGGCIGVIRHFSTSCQMHFHQEMHEEDIKVKRNIKPFLCLSILNYSTLAWFIAGNVWIYRTCGNWSSNSMDASYCDATLYLFSFWLVTFMYAFVFSLTFFVALLCSILTVCNVSESRISDLFLLLAGINPAGDGSATWVPHLQSLLSPVSFTLSFSFLRCLFTSPSTISSDVRGSDDHSLLPPESI